MADLPVHSTLDDKRKWFANGKSDSFIIDTKSQLDMWFADVEQDEKSDSKGDPTAMIYRGLSEAKYKLFTSAQRIWIHDDMTTWANKSYLEFISDQVNRASNNSLIKRVFDFYNYSRKDREFPILSLLQHYGAPTPLMDWTYNGNVAFFFATNECKRKEEPKTEIDNYFSVCRINKRLYKRELLNIIDFIGTYQYPGILEFNDFGDSNGNPNSNSIFYISDFERRGESTGARLPYGKLKIRTIKPITSVYNHNIIPQEGLLIFNPFKSKSLEEIFNPDLTQGGYNFAFTPFDCFNINKDLAEYLKRKIDVRRKINKAFIFPNLNDEAKKVKEQVLNGLI